MIKKRPDARATLPSLACVFLLLLTLKNSEIAANGIKKGILLFTNMLAPALLPFLVLSELLLALRADLLFTKYLSRPARFLFGLSPAGTSALFLGLLCGVPVGTVSAKAMLKNGKITGAEFNRLLLFANTPSTGFLIGLVGTALLGNKGAGVALFCITVLSSALTGIFLKMVYGDLPIVTQTRENGAEKRASLLCLTTAIRNGFSTLLGVAGFVLFFAAVTECVLSIPSLSPIVATVLCGLLELTAGTNTAVLLLSPEAAFLAIAFFAGFSGLSIAFQVLFIAENDSERPLSYLLAKMIQGGISSGLALLYLKLAAPTLKPATAGFSELSEHSLHLSPLLSVKVAFLFPVLILLLTRLARYRAVRFERTQK